MLTPSIRLCVCPLITSGASTLRVSRMVGTMSIAWWYWWRTSPLPAVAVVGVVGMVATLGGGGVSWWPPPPRPAGAVGGVGVGVAVGQEMMHGWAVPPLNSYRFHILNGVLNAIAPPLG